MSRIALTLQVITETIEILRRGGRRGEERVALWLASATVRTPSMVVEVYEPEQIADVDYFRLPPASMSALMRHLAATRRRIVAQIHTHPRRAYHSDVDAEWAIIRHVGALSLVLPKFATTTTSANFLDQVMTYEHTPDGDWALRPNVGRNAAIEMAR